MVNTWTEQASEKESALAGKKRLEPRGFCRENRTQHRLYRHDWARWKSPQTRNFCPHSKRLGGFRWSSVSGCITDTAMHRYIGKSRLDQQSWQRKPWSHLRCDRYTSAAWEKAQITKLPESEKNSRAVFIMFFDVIRRLFIFSYWKNFAYVL